MIFPPELERMAETVLAEARARDLKIATAESCTGGLIIALLTEIAGSSDVVERGFVTYANAAKEEMIGVPHDTLVRVGAVSEETARAMVAGALVHSRAGVAVAVTGIAGPGGGTTDKPVGLVHIAAGRKDCAVSHRECRFGNQSRSAIRLATVEAALAMLREVLSP